MRQGVSMASIYSKLPSLWAVAEEMFCVAFT